ncbi:MAG TPA: TAXI family TRAP transporter solute-binding subunit [Micromonosporaceae bacterium]|nr:TAXI family TRAP transporter solute-binding subunit [Micromonosporaceae bacterium]
MESLDLATDRGAAPAEGSQPTAISLRKRHQRLLALPIVIVVLVTLGISGAAAQPPEPAYPPGQLPIATGDRDTVYYTYGYALLQAVRLRMPELNPYLIVTPPSDRNPQLVIDGAAVLGFVGADTVDSLTHAGDKGLATLARLYDDYLHLVVRRDSGIRKLEDLRGRRTRFGVTDPGTKRIAIRLLQAAGVRETVTLRGVSVDTAAGELRGGSLDGFFFFGGVPTGILEQLNQVQPIRLLDIADWAPDVRSGFHSQLSIPAEAYDGVDSVTTLGVPTYLVVSRRMDPDLAYALTAMLFEERDTMAGIHPAVSRLDRRAAINTYPLELHQGAVRYYRETHI